MINLVCMEVYQMELDQKRAGILKRCKLSHYAIVVCVVLIFLQWLMPYFRYEPHDSKDLKQQTSMWGEILFNYNFMQLEDNMAEALNVGGEKVFKFVSLRQLGGPVLMMVMGIIILCTVGKSGIALNIFPLAMGIIGTKAYLFGSFLPVWANVTSGRLLGAVLSVIMLLLGIASTVFSVQEIKSRPADYYLPSIN